MVRYLPNVLTLLRFPLTALFLYGFFQTTAEWRMFATFCFILSALTDSLDGLVARRIGATSKVGAFLDPLADKVLVLSGFTALLLRTGDHWGDWYPWLVAAVIVIALREIAVTALRSYMMASQKPLVTSIWGKLKTTVQMVTLIAALVALNAAELFGWQSANLLKTIGIGIFISALLAAISAWDYFRKRPRMISSKQ